MMTSRIARATLALSLAGTIGIPQVDVGQYVVPGTVYATLQDLSKMRVDFSVPEQQIRLLAIGMPVTASSEVGGITLSGQISAIEPRIDPNSRLVTVRAEEQSGKPDKKVYAITSKGNDALARAISVLPARDKYKSEFLFQMLLQEYITPATMLAAIDKQLADLEADLQRIGECKCAEHPHAGARFVADYGKAVLSAAVNVLNEKKAELLRQSTPQAAE